MSKRYGTSFAKIGEVFDQLDSAPLSQRIRGTRPKYTEREATNLIGQMSNV
jgi:hypothetical protein